VSASWHERVRHPWAVRSAQIVIGAIFLVAALAKLGDLRSFAEQIHNFRMVPVAMENLVAMILPWVELVAAMALLLGIRARAGAVLTAAMMAAFTVAVALALVRGLDIECGCFGTADAAQVGVTKLLQNSAMLAVAMLGSLRPR
jgi:uncharacterized membrane protein YphA (DoxX/SURF4 family)